MGGLSAFMAPNVKKPENVKVVVSDRFVDEDGKPIEWEVRCISSEENEVLQRDCIRQVPIPGKRNQYRQTVDNVLYGRKLAAACTVFPNLNDAELQDSYHVKCAEDLIVKLLSVPGELAAYIDYLQEMCAPNQSLGDLVDEAKN